MSAPADRTDAYTNAPGAQSAYPPGPAENSAVDRRWRRRPIEAEANRDERFARAVGVPPHVRLGLVLYVDHGVEPGAFLTPVICNDFKEASARADNVSQQALLAILRWFLSEAPPACWGSPANMASWLASFAPQRQGHFPEALEAYNVNFFD